MISKGEFQYEIPQRVESLAEAYMYHTMELPGLGVVSGDWDLRPVLEDYTGRLDYCHWRVLDLGTATGFLSFALERQGARVVSYDQSDDHPWQLLPGWHSTREQVQRMKRGYWFCHRLLESKAKVFYGDVTRIPEALGRFDVALLGSLLLHCENPFAVIRAAARIARILVIVDTHRAGCAVDALTFRPCFNNPQGDFLVWWNMGPEAVMRMLLTCGHRPELPYTFEIAGPDGSRRTPLYCIVSHEIQSK